MDALGLIIGVVVTAASVSDNAIGIGLLDKVAEHTPTVTLTFVDAGFMQDFAVHGAVLGIAAVPAAVAHVGVNWCRRVS